MSNDLIPITDLERMAKAVVASKLFGVKTEAEAVTLMLLAQAEEMHPMKTIMEFDIIQGKPARKSWAMQDRFLKAGGKIVWHERGDTKASATFSHPQGGSITVDWDLDRAKKAGLAGKDMWGKYTRNMLSARVISEGVRAVYPGATGGHYTPEEQREMVDVTPAKPSKPAVDPLRQAEATMAGEVINGETGEIFPASVDISEPDPAVVAAAEAWAKDKIAWLETAPLDKVENALIKWRGKLAEIALVAPDAHTAVLTSAEIRKDQIRSMA